ncbi:endonuclease [Paenibacillus sp. PK3_47]|uniref:endonuclease/exonuclease/phosphatase family protein n=1 Tax=Paenibacillus sp. PK3_47 TaxID=2072642 RepID=UPI00201DD5A4|nr:endonuclease/exonuclease/phosphatase family protein [Paenibacillus sp. PK3_47]UQZ33623.1 endonuclease [Paenibacillus sp. PK3_47]
MTTYEMASFNIRFDSPADGENGWEFRKEHMLRLIRHYSWDVFGLQEAQGNQLRDLAALDDYEVEGISRDHNPESEHSPVFYKKSVFTKEDGGTFWLSETPEVPSKSWGSDCNRICTWVRLRDKRNGNRIHFMNTHLDHISEEARYRGALIILDWIRNHGGDLPVVLTGDFNAFPDERCYREITGQLTDTRRAADSHYGPWGTFTGFRYDIPWDQLKEIDYIFTDKQAKVLKTRTVTDSFDRKYPSDHYPVTATLEI